MSLYLVGLIGIGILYALFSRGGQKWLILVIIAITVYVVWYGLTYTSPIDMFIKEKSITIYKTTKNEVYGETQTDYYILYPALYYSISKTNKCVGFNPRNLDTWCGDEKIFPKCFDGDSCYLKFNKETANP